MSKFKVDDEVEAVSESFEWGLVKAGDLGVVKSLRGDEYFVRFPNQSTWRCYEKDLKLVKPKWSIYNNTLPWSELSDKQKGKMLLGDHKGIKFTIDNVAFTRVGFIGDNSIYKAQYIEPVKPEPTMTQLFVKDWNEVCDNTISGADRMIARGWNKPCK
jgi:hypothetical protein